MLKSILNIALFLIFSIPILLYSQDVNPFDVIHSGDPSELPDLPESIVNPEVLPDSSEILKPAFEESDEAPVTLPGFDNVFDVDHTPAKADELKRPVAEEAEPIENIKEEPSITTEEEPAKVKPERSISIDKIIGPIEKAPKPIARNIVFIILFLTLLIVTIVINIKRKTFVNLYRSIFNDNYLNLVQREENNGNSIFFLLLYLAYFFNATLFIHLTFQNQNIGGISFLFILVSIAVIYFIRHLSLRIMASVFPFQKAALQFNFTIIVFNCLLGIILFPLNAFYAYSPFTGIIFFLGISVFIFFYLIRQLRGFFLAMRISGLSLFHFFILSLHL